ncbi:MAG: radical SAM protein [Candidatus Omnitrophica bacterium]|jgi:MoaA/NifB/PqqE/SkfB family radical SAM enzyme|nr:radical SAM protein [Candidatus Omnitrophota bacterium]
MYIPSKVDIIKLFLKHPLYHQDLILRKIRFYLRYRWLQKYKDKNKEIPLPLAFKLYLTLKCNLRCKMCMFWGEKGICNTKNDIESYEELDYGVIKDLFQQVGSYHPFFILSGGEPLLHSHFEDIADLLKNKRYFAYICTNGMLLDKFRKVISNNPYLVLAISLDGLREINDFLRGKGVFDKVISNIKMLKSIKKPPYIGIQFTLQTENVGILYDTCKEVVRLGVDWVLINLRWCLTEDQGQEYEKIIKRQFNVHPKSHLGFITPYHIDKDKFLEQCRKIRKEKWPIQISSYLKKPEDIHTYLDSPQINSYNSFCYKQWLRMDVMPNADVTPCIQYPDLKMGNLKEEKLNEIWNSSKFKEFRHFIKERLLPVCSRCYVLYLYDKNRAHL